MTARWGPICHVSDGYSQVCAPSRPGFLLLAKQKRFTDMGFILPDAADADSPLKFDELQVLRAQYEKEGYYVGVQTKFNYAWVLAPPYCWKVSC